MSEEKPKYVRKKCEHGKQKYLCKECGGSQLCSHDKIKTRCKLCKGKYLCEHNIYKYYCKLCKGNGICIHNNYKDRCITCNYDKKCSHNKIKSLCVLCNTKLKCEHNNIKYKCNICNICNINKKKIKKKCKHNKNEYYCKQCNGKGLCTHEKRKSRCDICNGRERCEHNKIQYICKLCKGKGRCIHDKIKSICVLCEGSYICPHKKRKSHCKKCGGSALCKSEWCETTGNVRYDGYCLHCFIHLFPDKPNVKNYKTKEKAVTDYVLEQFPLEKYSWISDKRIQDGCSRKRPDLFIDLGYQIIIVEVDENQHESYDCSCENKRLMELSQDLNHRPIIFIRFNPDEYTDNDKKVTSCWGINKLGVCAVKKTKIKEWESRLNALKNQIDYWCNIDNITDKTLEVVQLYYDTNL